MTYFNKATKAQVEARQWQHPGTWMRTMEPVETGTWIVKNVEGKEFLVPDEEFQKTYTQTLQSQKEFWASQGWPT